jgi:hypothetical protein
MEYTRLQEMQKEFEKEVADVLEADRTKVRIHDVALGWAMAKGVELEYARGFAHDAYLYRQYKG